MTAEVTDWSSIPRDQLDGEVSRTFAPRDIAQYYDEWNAAYEASFGDVFQHLQTTDRAQLFDHLAEAAGVIDGDRILDAGCGVCGPAVEFARRADVAIDAVTLSAVQVERARENVERAGLNGRIAVHLGDFHRLDELFAPASFDLVYFLEAFVHSDDPLAALRSVHEVLRPGGRIYIKDFYRGQATSDDDRRIIDECVAATNAICHLTIRDFDDVLGWLSEAGFDIEWSRPFAAMPYDISAGHAFCAANDLDVAAGRDFTTTYYLDSHEVLAQRR